MGARTTRRYQGDNQRDFDDRDSYSQNKGPERLAHAMGDHFGVVDRGQDRAHQKCCDPRGEQRLRGNLPS
jgi:hypothetical protein